jgi:hypothetical protein
MSPKHGPLWKANSLGMTFFSQIGTVNYNVFHLTCKMKGHLFGSVWFGQARLNMACSSNEALC